MDRNALVRPTVRRRKAECRRWSERDDGRHRQRHRVPMDNGRRPGGVQSPDSGIGRHKRRALAKVDGRTSSDSPRELALTARQRPGGRRLVLGESGRGPSARPRPSRPNWRIGQARRRRSGTGAGSSHRPRFVRDRSTQAANSAIVGRREVVDGDDCRCRRRLVGSPGTMTVIETANRAPLASSVGAWLVRRAPS